MRRRLPEEFDSLFRGGACTADRLTRGKIGLMEMVTVSSKGQVAIPRAIRDALNLRHGARLTVEMRGHEIVLSKEPAWKRLEGSAAGTDLMSKFEASRKHERELEDSRS